MPTPDSFLTREELIAQRDKARAMNKRALAALKVSDLLATRMRKSLEAQNRFMLALGGQPQAPPEFVRREATP